MHVIHTQQKTLNTPTLRNYRSYWSIIYISNSSSEEIYDRPLELRGSPQRQEINLVGYGWGTVPGSVIARGSGDAPIGNTWENIQEIRESRCQDVGYSIVSENDREQVSLAVDTLSFTTSLEDVLAGYYDGALNFFFFPHPSVCGGGSPAMSSWFTT